MEFTKSEYLKKLAKRITVIGLGISSILFAAQIIISVSYTPEDGYERTGVLYIGLLFLMVFSLLCWLFFSTVFYKRMLNMSSVVEGRSKKEKFMEGVFGYIGIAVALPSIMGIMFFAVSHDFLLSLPLYFASLMLLTVELFRLNNRDTGIEDSEEA